MSDLNDLHIFSQVVEHNGFSGAARALGIARSSVCRRVAQLEARLGVRLVQRTTRQFMVTDIGREFHSHCLRMMTEVHAAYELAAHARATPAGQLRIVCPTVLAHSGVGALIPRFALSNPQVRIVLEATDRKVELEDNFD